MLTNQIYICEKCGRQFSIEQQCLEHEKTCNDKKINVYRYELVFTDINKKNFIIRLTKYNAMYTRYNSNVIDLIPSYHDVDKLLDLDKIKFDEVYYNTAYDVFYIYTLNESHEIYIEKLINYIEKRYYKDEEEITKRRKNLIEKYVTKDFKFINDGFVKENNFYVGE